MVGAGPGASGVEIGAGNAAVCGAGVEGLVVGAEVAGGCAVDVAALAGWEKDFLDGVSVAVWTGPDLCVSLAAPTKICSP